MARKYRSRLARKESKRIMRQSLLLFVLTGFMLVGLFIWGVPAIIRFASFLGEVRSSSIPIENNDTLAPYPPQVSIPYEATSSAQITINGYGEELSTVRLFNNDEEISSTEVNDQGEFIFESVKLDSGENNFSVQAVDQAGNESEISSITPVFFDNQAPEVEITDPSDGTTFYTSQQQSVEIKGTVSEEAQVYVNERITFSDSDGNFSQRVYLEEGENEIKVRAVDQALNQTETSIKLSFVR